MNLPKVNLTIPKSSRPLVLVLVVGIILGAGYYFIIGNAMEKKNSLKAEVVDARQELSRLTRIKNGMDKARQEQLELKDRLEEVLNQMPEEKEVPNLLRQISFVGQETKTRIKYFSPKDQIPGELHAELPFEIKYSADYHSLGYFFDGIRHLERIVHIVNFSLESKSSTTQKTVIEGACTGKTYVYLKEGDRQKIKKGDKDKKDKKDEKDGPSK